MLNFTCAFVLPNVSALVPVHAVTMEIRIRCMYVCMYVCTYVRTYVRMYVMCVHVCIHVCACIYFFMHRWFWACVETFSTAQYPGLRGRQCSCKFNTDEGTHSF